MATTATATDVENAYLAYFGRPADPEGMNYWIGKSVAAMQAGFAASQEYKNLYGGMTNTQVVTQVYQNLLGRAPDPGGLAYWVNQMNQGAATIATIVTQMQANAEGVDIATLANRFVFAIHFTEDLTSPSQIAGYSGTAAANAARVAVSEITNLSSSLATAESNMALDIQAVDKGESPVALAAANASAAAAAATAAATNASNLASYGSINGVTQTSAANTFVLSSGSNTVTMVVGTAAVTDTFDKSNNPTAVTLNISGSSTGPLTLAETGTYTGTSMTLAINDSTAAAVTVDSMHAGHVSSATFNNTGTATLTDNGMTVGSVLANVDIQGTGAENFANITSAHAGFALSDSSSAAVGITALTAGAGAESITNSGNGTLTIGTAIMSAGSGNTLTISNSGSGGIVDTADTTTAGTVSLTNTGSAALASTLSDVVLATLDIGGVGTSTSGTISATVTDTLASTLTIDDTQSTTAGVATVALGLSSTVTGLTVTDSSTAALTLSSFTDNNLATLTLDNTGSAALASTMVGSGLTTLDIGGVGTSTNGTIGATVTDTLAGTLTINDTQSATAGAATVALGLSSTVTGLTVTDSSTAALGLSAATDASLTTATFGNTGTGTLTVSTLTAAALATVSMTGSGQESVSITNASTAMAITDSNTNTSTTITLGSHTGHVDTTVVSTTSAISEGGFVAGASGDVISVSVGSYGSLVDGNAVAITSATASTAVTTAVGSKTTLAAGQTELVLTTTSIANDSTLLSDIQGGTSAITFASSVASGKGFLVAYEDGTNVHVVEVVQGTAGTVLTGASIHDVITLTGTVTTLVTGNFAFHA
ncbi:DUF4214 domain-containing protein [Ferrovum sp.]|uniref:DUF4214 domain-containing protein n=1 Tax=Ferrovum sp. TaxID=2609467 RepID=UPI002625D7F6|nr:DUF4214 domain-containing protein [Ferrovum sp.]